MTQSGESVQTKTAPEQISDSIEAISITNVYELNAKLSLLYYHQHHTKASNYI